MTGLPVPDDDVDRARRAAVGRRIRSLRQSLGTSEAEFAGRLGRSSAWLGAVETGLRDTTIDELWRIADELAVRLADLVVGIDVETEQ